MPPNGKTKNNLDAAKGGRARAEVLTAEDRSEIARKAAQARWAKAGKAQPAGEPPTPPDDRPIAVAEDDGDALPYSKFPGRLPMGDAELECHVLSDGRRVLTAREVVRALRGTRTNPPSIQRYLDALPGYRIGMFDDRMMHFRLPGLPQTALGLEATVLIEMCDMYITADENGDLTLIPE